MLLYYAIQAHFILLGHVEWAEWDLLLSQAKQKYLIVESILPIDDVLIQSFRSASLSLPVWKVCGLFK